MNADNYEPSGINLFWGVVGFGGILWGIGAALLGLILRLVAGRFDREDYREAQGYAELNGWHSMTATKWQSFRGNLRFTVQKSAVRQAWLLIIETSSGESVASDSFDSPYRALRFADYLHRTELSKAVTVTRDAVRRAIVDHGHQLTSGRG